MKKNEKGSSLIFAVVVIMMISIIIAAAMAISFSYYNRSIANNSKRQSYLTAKSVVSNVVENIKGHDPNYIALIPNEKGVTKDYVIDFEQLQNDMGKVNRIYFTRTEEEKDTQKYDVLLISVDATYGGKTTNLCAEMKKSFTATDWQLVRYYEGEVKISKNLASASELNSNVIPLFEFVEKKDESGLKQYFASHNFDNGGKYIFDNSTSLRPFVHQILQKNQPQKLDLNEFQLSDKAKAYYKDKSVYLHVMFGRGGEEPKYIIYATQKMSSQENDWKPEFVYRSDTGHWYYREQTNGQSQFSDMAGMHTDAKGVYDLIMNECVDIAQ